MDKTVDMENRELTDENIEMDDETADPENTEPVLPEDGDTGDISEDLIPQAEKIFDAPRHASSPDVQLNIGALGFIFPIHLPPGTNNLTPEVSLSYNSSAKNGIAGVGWHLNMACIQRSTKKGLCYECNDFIFNGQDLVPVTVNINGKGIYRTEKELEFSHIEFKSDNTWTITLKNGIKHYYRPVQAFSNPLTGADDIFRWHLSTIRDTNGNEINYHYLFNEPNGPQDNQVYLGRIDYAGNFYTVQFNYENEQGETGRNDIDLRFISHYRVATTKRLISITVYSASPGQGKKTVKAYGFRYNHGPDSQHDPTGSLTTSRSLLSKITTFGSDFIISPNGAIIGGTALPPQEMYYYEGDRQLYPTPNLPPDVAPGIGVVDDKYNTILEFPVITGDWNGDGRQDIARVGPNGVVFLFSDGASFDYYYTLDDFYPALDATPQKFINNDDHQIFTGDWNGDGRTDIGRIGNEGIRFFISTTTLDLAPDFQAYPGISGYNTGPASWYPVFTGDFNGDGKTDLGKLGNYDQDPNVYVFLSTGSGFEEAITVDSLPFTKWHFKAPFIIGDFTGDGKMELGRIGNEYINILKYNGHGFEEHCRLHDLTLAQAFYDNYNNPVITGDFNGDGLTDIGRQTRSTENRKGIRIYYSTGNGFEKCEPDIVFPFAMNYQPNSLFCGDFNADGLSDFGIIQGGYYLKLYISTGRTFEQYHEDPLHVFPYQFKSRTLTPFFTGDFTGDGKDGFCHFAGGVVKFYSPNPEPADLIREIKFSRGSKTGISYKPSSGGQNGYLPSVLQTVAELVTDDGLGNTSKTTFLFSGKTYSQNDREYKSFKQAVKTLPNGTREVVTFYQYNDLETDDKFLDGRIKSIVLKDDLSILSTVENIWESRPYGDGSSFISLRSTQMTLFENGHTPYLSEAFEYSEDHGSLIQKTTSGTGIPHSIINTYDYGYFGAGCGSPESIRNAGTYPLRITMEQTATAETGMVRKKVYHYKNDCTGNLEYEESVNTTGENPVTAYDYDSFGNIIAVTDARSNTTRYYYDDEIHAHIISIQQPATGGGCGGLFEFDHITEFPQINYAYGKPLEFKDENGFSTCFTYDPFGRIRTVTFPDGGSETYTYSDNPFPNPRSVTRSISGPAVVPIETVTWYDGHDRPVQRVSNAQQGYAVSLQTYDDMGREKCTYGPFFEDSRSFLLDLHTRISADPATVGEYKLSTWTRNSYDDRSRIQTVEQSGDITTAFVYNGLSVTETDPDSRKKTTVRDMLDRIVTVIQHTGSGDIETRYDYNAAGDLLMISRDHPDTAAPVENCFQYNMLGQKTGMTDPDLGQWAFTYDLNGNLETQTDAAGHITVFEYDGLNRLTWRLHSTTDFAKFEYDQAENGIGYLYRKSKNDTSTVISGYDSMGRPLTETRTAGGKTAEYAITYDIAGRISSKVIKINGGFFRDLFYDYYPGTSLVHEISNNWGNVYAEIARYTPAGKIERLENGNGSCTEYIYDYATGRLAEVSALSGGDLPEIIVDRIYTCSKAGDIDEILDNRSGVTCRYTYDHLHRLTSETTQGTACPSGVEADVLEFRYADDDEYPLHAPAEVIKNGTSYTIRYDANGNRTGVFRTGNDAADYVYESNRDHMIKRITAYGKPVDFYYDADNRRVRKTTPNWWEETWYLGQEIEIRGGIPRLHLFAGNLRVAEIEGNDSSLKFYLHKDHLGSTCAVTGSSGQFIEGTDYFPYGLARNGNGLDTTAYQFTDQEFDDSLLLYNYDARLYDPESGQFIMADTLLPDVYHPQALNRYAYCLNNPLKNHDPTGHYTKNLNGKFAYGSGFAAVLSNMGMGFNSMGHAGVKLAKGDIDPAMKDTIKTTGIIVGVGVALATPADKIGLTAAGIANFAKTSIVNLATSNTVLSLGVYSTEITGFIISTAFVESPAPTNGWELAGAYLNQATRAVMETIESDSAADQSQFNNVENELNRIMNEFNKVVENSLDQFEDE